MNTEEQCDIGRKAAENFMIFWQKLIDEKDEYAGNLGMQAIFGMIFFEGFCEGYDYHKEKMQEIASSN